MAGCGQKPDIPRAQDLAGGHDFVTWSKVTPCLTDIFSFHGRSGEMDILTLNLRIFLDHDGVCPRGDWRAREYAHAGAGFEPRNLWDTSLGGTAKRHCGA